MTDYAIRRGRDNYPIPSTGVVVKISIISTANAYLSASYKNGIIPLSNQLYC